MQIPTINPATIEKLLSTDWALLLTEEEKERGKQVMFSISAILAKGKAAVFNGEPVYFSSEETRLVGNVYALFFKIDFENLEKNPQAEFKKLIFDLMALEPANCDKPAKETEGH